ncbi:MAG: bifunctional diaminohydroxyphosphoribosylaminopyrimidine deaminase/5-amino-6-(5-phosphoribosylamino)uracil reductase RibD [Bacteroidota bacterium]
MRYARKERAEDSRWMQRCVQLARKGYGYVRPNPMVGAVIVKNGKLIAEGYHQKFAGPHAEVHALRRAGKRAKGAVLYVNLEPCAHYGKTPPCVDAIIHAGIKEVVVGSLDPNPFVPGRGAAQLRKAGIKVRVGIERVAAEALNEKFYTFMRTGLPFVGYKVAQTLDGKIADVNGKSKWITGPNSRKYAHSLRLGYDAVLVGARTVRMDDPELTIRLVQGPNPVRVVVDGRMSVPPQRKIFDESRARTVILTSGKAFLKHARRVKEFQRRHVELIPVSKSWDLDPRLVLKALAGLGITSVLIEGGSETSGKFLRSRIGGKLHCFIGPKIIGGGKESFRFSPPAGLLQAARLTRSTWRSLDEDLLIEGSIEFP